MATDCSWLSRLRKPLFLLYGAAAIAQPLVDWLFANRHPGLPARYFLGFVPALIWFLFIAAFIREVLKTDEFQQRIQMLAASVAFILTVAVAVVFSGLDRIGIYRLTWRDYASPLMLLLLIGYLYSAWRYR